MSTTRYGAGATSASPVVAPRNDSRASSLAAQQLRRHAERIGRGGRRTSSRFSASRAAEVAVARTAATSPTASIALAVLAERGDACARSPRARAAAVASTPWPSRVIVMRRSSVDERAVGSSDLRHEQARRVGPDVDRRGPHAHRLLAAPPRVSARGHPVAHRIVTAGEPVGVVRVEALDAHAGPADAAERTRAVVIGGDRRVPLGRVPSVRRGQRVRRRPSPGRRAPRRRPRAGTIARERSGSTSQ